jgi:hypothetical protein
MNGMNWTTLALPVGLTDSVQLCLRETSGSTRAACQAGPTQAKSATSEVPAEAMEFLLFWVRDDVVEVVSITLDGEMKTPPSRDSGLPDITGFVVLLGAQGGVA